jgi:hypothetical protein
MSKPIAELSVKNWFLSSSPDLRSFKLIYVNCPEKPLSVGVYILKDVLFVLNILNQKSITYA